MAQIGTSAEVRIRIANVRRWYRPLQSLCSVTLVTYRKHVIVPYYKL